MGADVTGADVMGADVTGADVTGAEEGAEVTGDEVANVVVTVAPVLTFGTMKKNYLGYCHWEKIDVQSTKIMNSELTCG